MLVPDRRLLEHAAARGDAERLRELGLDLLDVLRGELGRGGPAGRQARDGHAALDVWHALRGDDRDVEDDLPLEVRLGGPVGRDQRGDGQG